MYKSDTPIPSVFGGNRDGLPYETRPRKRLTDDEMRTFITMKSGSGDKGRDPTYQQLQQMWFASILWFAGIRGYQPADFGLDIDEGLIPRTDSFNANYLFRIIMGQVARLSSANPKMSVTPKSPDIDDQIAAKVAEAFLHHYDDTFNFRSMRRDLSFWTTICGTAFAKADWDDQAGPELVSFVNPFGGDPIPERMLTDRDREFLEKAKSKKVEYTGELDCQVMSPFQVITPRGFRRLKDMPWLILEHEVSIDWIHDHYPNKAKEIRVDDQSTKIDEYWWRRLANIVNRIGFPSFTQGSDNDETILLRELWIPPSRRFPRGAYGRMTRTVLLENGPHPFAAADLDIRRYPHMRFPITPFRYAPVPGRFWGQSLIEHLIDPQEDYNVTRQQLMQQRDMLYQPQWIQESGSEVGPKRNEYGWFLEYAQGSKKPEVLNPPSLSQAHIATLDHARQDMEMISAQSDASLARVPEGVRSGVAIRYLQEKDMMVVGPTVEDMEDGWQEFNRRVLTLTWKFGNEPQMIQAYGEFRQGDVTIYKGSQLNGNVFVRIQRGSMLPKSRAEATSMTFDLIQNGMLNPMNPKDREIALKTMELGTTDSLFDERNADRRRATIENYMFWKPQVDPQTGQAIIPDVDDDDDHLVHLEEHRRFKKTDAYEKLPTMRKMIFDAHAQLHKEHIARAMEAQMMMQAGPPGPGGGSPPREPGKASPPADRQETPGSTPGPNS